MFSLVSRKFLAMRNIALYSVVSSLSFPFCNENLNSFLISVGKLFKGGNYSREETTCGNTVFRATKVDFL